MFCSSRRERNGPEQGLADRYFTKKEGIHMRKYTTPATKSVSQGTVLRSNA
ncbi:hypothetical protein [Streptomyces sp. NPDC048516]|uniref:hypothetical protein n=1 Tax=Streptomyces sp. NPDC048516 TaxID=3365565 RepID=UPI003724232F